MSLYVVGFIFDQSCSRVALVRKTHPVWQAGRLNGCGGEVSLVESTGEAMVREAFEEVGLESKSEQWAMFGVLKGDGFRVHCYTIATPDFDLLVTKTDEALCPVDLQDVSLAWLRRQGLDDLLTLIATALQVQMALIDGADQLPMFLTIRYPNSEKAILHVEEEQTESLTQVAPAAAVCNALEPIAIVEQMTSGYALHVPYALDFIMEAVDPATRAQLQFWKDTGLTHATIREHELDGSLRIHAVQSV